MADRLVHLEPRLVGVEDERRQLRRTDVGAEECGRLLRHPRRLPLETEPLDDLPTSLFARPDVRGRIAAELVDAVAARRAVDPTAAFDELVLDVRPLR